MQEEGVQEEQLEEETTEAAKGYEEETVAAPEAAEVLGEPEGGAPEEGAEKVEPMEEVRPKLWLPATSVCLSPIACCPDGPVRVPFTALKPET